MTRMPLETVAGIRCGVSGLTDGLAGDRFSAIVQYVSNTMNGVGAIPV